MYAVLAVLLVVIAGLTGGDPARAGLVGLVFFVVATAWSWWRFRERIRDRDTRREAGDEVPGPEGGNGNGRRR